MRERPKSSNYKNDNGVEMKEPDIKLKKIDLFPKCVYC